MENLSFAELSELLVAKQEEVEEIRTEFSELKEKFSSLEERFERVVGDAPPARQNGNAKQFKSLADFIRDVLANSHQPMTTTDIAKEVLKAGYKTTASRPANFGSMVQQACSKAPDIKRVGKATARPHRYILN
jgi:hypothetical protein